MSSNIEFFKALESDLITLSRYIEISNQNFSAYSIEIAKLLMLSCSQLDSSFKSLCAQVDPNQTPDRITQYYSIIALKYPKLSTIEINTRYGVRLKPFANWINDHQLTWWQGYNAIKHSRESNFALANLENVLNAMSALFTIMLYNLAAQRNGSPSIDSFEAPTIFSVYVQQSTGGARFSNAGILNSYPLPDYP